MKEKINRRCNKLIKDSKFKLLKMVVQMGFPEPGNLKSKKVGEIKKTLHCFAEILKQ